MQFLQQLLHFVIDYFLPLLLLLLLVLALFGSWRLKPDGATGLHADPVAGPTSATPTLFVLMHGLDPDADLWAQMVATLQPHGHVLRLRYDASRWSNADPERIASEMADQVQAAATSTQAKRVVLVAHSMGALLARRTLLVAQNQPWAARVQRVVLLAGANRGWDLAGEPPADINPAYRALMRFGYWGAHLVGSSRLLFHFERGAPFVANLRLDWMRWMRQLHSTQPERQIEVVQMLGDIDNIVSRQDNEDLRVMASSKFALLRVRGTGHGDIIDFGAHAKGEEKDLGDYRRQKFLLAATARFEDVQQLNEEQPYTTNEDITEVVFVLHGIRDLGRWSADVEKAIDQRFPGRRQHLAIVSSRYGYFGMGPFLFEGVRDKYVRWFMDEYTETLARFPNVKPENIRFFGHSNGTYIVAEALQRYSSMRIERVVFAGSVVPKAYDWAALGSRVKQVRNYVGTHDWVVALFPRLFELPVLRWFGNSIGSAGFNGFDDEQRVDNVRYVQGAHGAFDSRVDEIVGFLLAPGDPVPAKIEARKTLDHVLGFAPLVLLVWAALASVVLYIGARVVGASPSPSWLVLLIYALLVLRILQTV